MGKIIFLIFNLALTMWVFAGDDFISYVENKNIQGLLLYEKNVDSRKNESLKHENFNISGAFGIKTSNSLEGKIIVEVPVPMISDREQKYIFKFDATGKPTNLIQIEFFEERRTIKTSRLEKSQVPQNMSWIFKSGENPEMVNGTDMLLFGYNSCETPVGACKKVPRTGIWSFVKYAGKWHHFFFQVTPEKIQRTLHIKLESVFKK